MGKIIKVLVVILLITRIGSAIAIAGIVFSFISNKDTMLLHPILRNHLSIMATSVDEEKIAADYFDQILTCLEEKDKEKLKNLFAKRIQETNQTLDKDMEYVYQFFDGTVTDISEIYGPITDMENHYGEKHSVISCYYIVTTDKDKYIVFMKICNDDSEDDNIGLQMLQVIRKKEEEELFDWGENTDCKGIYIPDRAQKK